MSEHVLCLLMSACAVLLRYLCRPTPMSWDMWQSPCLPMQVQLLYRSWQQPLHKHGWPGLVHDLGTQQ
jgi:hypothetical protein